MNSENSDLGNELRQMERNINYYKTKLQSCRDRYENVEMGICDVKRFQQKALFELNNARMEEQNLQEHLEMIRLNHEACVEKSGGYEDLDEKVRVTISELTTQRSTLMEELVQMRKITDINGKKLARVNTMIEEQEVILMFVFPLLKINGDTNCTNKCSFHLEKECDFALRVDEKVQRNRFHPARYTETNKRSSGPFEAGRKQQRYYQ